MKHSVDYDGYGWPNTTNLATSLPKNQNQTSRLSKLSKQT